MGPSSLTNLKAKAPREPGELLGNHRNDAEPEMPTVTWPAASQLRQRSRRSPSISVNSSGKKEDADLQGHVFTPAQGNNTPMSRLLLAATVFHYVSFCCVFTLLIRRCPILSSGC